MFTEKDYKKWLNAIERLLKLIFTMCIWTAAVNHGWEPNAISIGLYSILIVLDVIRLGDCAISIAINFDKEAKYVKTNYIRREIGPED